ncbi:hypothetical protein [Methylobacter sp. S3L5C]|uniref:hypothetical protein n=1 Tax=Methylobacter sp. S3L5C TaxID=2839024 RepID=UPI001FADE046|nr:hypothetical protein [Methylobacter sp. S3L5C]UOA09186.1 hypothetical protein KKZ03_02385 [Methylobacter sp. S3L5C]
MQKLTILERQLKEIQEREMVRISNLKTAWHYTTGEKFIKIVESGLLIPTSIGVEHPEKPILWFSSNQYWEPTACKAIYENNTITTLTMDETKTRGGGLVRFGLPLKDLHHWNKLIKKSKMSVNVALGLESAGVRQGANPNHWYGLTKAIPLSKCPYIEVIKDDLWVRVKPA